MADNVAVTPGSGGTVRAKNIGGVLTQIVQIDLGGESAEFQLIADATYGVPVDIKRFPAGAVLVNNPTAGNLKVDASGVAVPITDNSGSLTVDAPKTTPLGVRLSDGTNWVDTLPVSGTLTANQGTAAVTANAWPTIITDGTNVAQVDPTSHGLKVYIAAGGGGGVSQADGSTFTEASTSLNVIGGEYNSSAAAVLTGKAGAVQITQYRGLHINLRTAAGVEIGTLASALRIDPTGATTQPVSGTITAKLKDDGGTAYSATNPLEVQRSGRKNVRVSNSVALIASQTLAAVWTPAGGKKFYIDKIVLIVTTAGPLKLLDSTATSARTIADSGAGVNWPTGVYTLDFDEPWASDTADNVLKYTSGSALVAQCTVHGHEA